MGTSSEPLDENRHCSLPQQHNSQLLDSSKVKSCPAESDQLRDNSDGELNRSSPSLRNTATKTHNRLKPKTGSDCQKRRFANRFLTFGAKKLDINMPDSKNEGATNKDTNSVENLSVLKCPEKGKETFFDLKDCHVDSGDETYEENSRKEDRKMKLNSKHFGADNFLSKDSNKTANSSIPLYSRAGWQLFAICYLVGVQSSLTTGFVNSCYSTLEKLFNFNSKFTGLIEGSFHVAIVLLVIPVSFYGRKGNKPLIMAVGAALIAVGAFCYSSAEFFRDQPFTVLNITHISKATGPLQDPSGCITNGGAASQGNGTGEESAWVKWLFVSRMFLIGVGSTPIQTVAIAYLDQGSKQEENTGWSLGWFHAVGLLAPALGFVLSGSFLSMPIDFSSWAMSTEDDSFMGAWWMGFMLECALALILVPVLLTLPNRGNSLDVSKEPSTPSVSTGGSRCHSRKQSQNSLKQHSATNASTAVTKTGAGGGSGVSSNNNSSYSPSPSKRHQLTTSLKGINDNDNLTVDDTKADSTKNMTSFTFTKDPHCRNTLEASSPQNQTKHHHNKHHYQHHQQKENQEHQDSVQIDSPSSQTNLQLAEFWLCVKCLMKDKTFLCLLLHGSVLHMTTAGLTAFIPKFFETQYRMIAQIAAFVAGGVSVPAAAIGAIISGYLIKRMQLNCLGTIKMTFWAQGTCIFLCAIFFIIRCPYGHVYMWDELDKFQEETGLNSSHGLCEGTEMQIHCVNSLYNIYSPCVLQCVQLGTCGHENISVSLGLCEPPGQCHWRVPAFAIFFITFLVASMVAVPRIFALLRLVQDDWKTISLGIQWVFFRLLGMIPGPLVYGQIFDSACTQWGSFSMTCASSHSGGHCSFYNSATLRNYMIFVTVGSLVIGELCLFFAIRFYEKEHQGPGKKGYIAPPEEHVITVVHFDHQSQHQSASSKETKQQPPQQQANNNNSLSFALPTNSTLATDTTLSTTTSTINEKDSTMISGSECISLDVATQPSEEAPVIKEETNQNSTLNIVDSVCKDPNLPSNCNQSETERCTSA